METSYARRLQQLARLLKLTKVYQYKMTDDFIPYHAGILNISECSETPIASLIEQLDFIKNKKSWGYQFRFGFFVILVQDFELISSKMMSKHE